MPIWKIIERIILILISSIILLLLIIHLPSRRIIFQSEITNPGLGTYDLVVDLPNSGLVGKSERISFHFTAIDSDDNSKINDPNTKINLGVDLIITGGILKPQGLLVTPLTQNNHVELVWNLIPEDYFQLPGTIHVSIIDSKEKSSSPGSRNLLFSKDFSIKLKKIFGLSFPKIKSILLGAIIVLFILFFGIKLKSKVN